MCYILSFALKYLSHPGEAPGVDAASGEFPIELDLVAMSDRGAIVGTDISADDGERKDSRLIFVFFFACALVLALAAVLLVVISAGSVTATRRIADFTMSIALAWHSDTSMAIQIMPYIGVFLLAMTAPLRRTRKVFWVSMVLLFVIMASYQILVWQCASNRWIFNSLIGTDMIGKVDVLQSFFATVRNGALVLMASMLGLAANKDAKN